MSTLHKASRAVLSGFGIALVAALAIVSGCASGDISDASGQSNEVSYGEATEALRIGLEGSFMCDLGSRNLGTLEVNSNPGPGGPFCQIDNRVISGASSRFCRGFPPNQVCNDCNDLGESFGCRF
jgi:hypothetical protein